MTYTNCNKSIWWKRNFTVLIIILFGIIFINLIFISEAFRETDSVNPETAAQLGDFVGGYIGTFFVLISIVLIYLTFKKQSESIQHEKFENKYFELLKIHRDNVAEIGIGNDFGRKIFVIMVREFRIILSIVKEISKKTNQKYSQKDILIISYYAFYVGVGPNSSRILKESLKSYNINFVEELVNTLNNKEIKQKAINDRNLKFNPFEGHQSRLGHYYRHLYQTVCFVDKQTFSLDKYEYVKTIRAQLTNHEQALLLINSLTPLGNEWWEKKLLINYKFVKNIPYGFFDKENEIDLSVYFPNEYFEWENKKI